MPTRSRPPKKTNAAGSVHVVPSNGGWIVRPVGAAAVQTFATQSAAVRAAQDAVRIKGGWVKVQMPSGRSKTTFTLGREAGARISAVEGVCLTPAMQADFKDFDRQGLEPAERRARLAKKYGGQKG